MQRLFHVMCCLAAIAAMPAAQGQWVNLKTAGVPRTADCKANLTAPAPKTADGKPDLSAGEEPDANCLPQGVPKIDAAPAPFKIFQTTGQLAILQEAFNLWRQIFLDGR